MTYENINSRIFAVYIVDTCNCFAVLDILRITNAY